MTGLMIILFLAGYLLITIEHKININKAAIGLLTGSVLWIIYMYAAPSLVPLVSGEAFKEYISSSPSLMKNTFIEQIRSFVLSHQIIESIGEISETLLFLMAAMTIVEFIDSHSGFYFVSDIITTKNKKRLLWIVSFATFFMSALLDNLTTTIIMIMLLRKLLNEKQDRWIFGSMVVIAANSGGAWSPIGDVTTIMLWVKGNLSMAVVPTLILPSLVSMIVPVLISQRFLKGDISENQMEVFEDSIPSEPDFKVRERFSILILGVGLLVLTPVFKMITHLPPFIWLLFSVGVMWIYSELFYNRRKIDEAKEWRVGRVLSKIDFSTIMFFLGILFAVEALRHAGILTNMSNLLAAYMPNVYAQCLSIGILSSIVDNVPLVAAAIAMYPVVDSALVSTMANPQFMQNFVADGVFWHFLAYTAGIGGSILIVGSAAGVILMGLEKVTFGWYLKRISLIAFIGYMAGAAVYILQQMFIS